MSAERPDGAALRALPAVGRLLQVPALAVLPRALAREACRAALDAARQRVRAGGPPPGLDAIVAEVLQGVARARRPQLRPVINAAGVVLHTNLGRAPLHPDAVAALTAVARGYSTAELDLETGRRGGRGEGVRARLRALTGAEDALVVNNNAAAVLLALTALAAGREVLISRGELVEIGGGFRVPDVISAGGARLVEVGTTNRTRVDDYARALGPNTALLLRVHPSNFRQIGFVERPERGALAALAAAAGVPLVEDLGSGLLGAPPRAGVGLESEGLDRALAEGADLVCASGDKLLGGPQAGLILGRAALVERLRVHPLTRALRVDKLTLAALEATLSVYAEGRADEVPARALLARGADELRRAAEAWAATLPGARVAPASSVSGGGALPGVPLEGYVVALASGDPDRLAHRLRVGEPAVLARVADGAVLLDPRAVLPGEEGPLLQAVHSALAAEGAAG